jgi:hypothetical protein
MSNIKLVELEKMAKQTAAFGVHPSGEFIYSFYTEQLQAFAKLIAEHERQECALLCYEQRKHWDALACADAIRAGTKPRGQT